MSFQHKTHLTQKNKPHSKSQKTAGKVDSTQSRSHPSQVKGDLGKEDRFNRMVQLRKQKRGDLLMKRRGLNFITEDHEQVLDEDTI